MLIEKIRINFNRKAPYKGKNYTYQNILYDNVQQLANFVSDKRKDIEFVIPKLEINRKDTISLKEKILSMSPKDRKRLGINKSTLWYMKNNIEKGKRIKLYRKTSEKIPK